WLYPMYLPTTYFSSLGTQEGALLHVERMIKSDSLFGHQAEEELAQFLERPENKDGTIEVISYTPGIRWRAGREKATRFTTVRPLAMRLPGFRFTAYQESMRAEFVRTIVSKKPKFLLIATGPKNIDSFS